VQIHVYVLKKLLKNNSLGLKILVWDSLFSFEASVTEPHLYDAAPGLGKNFDAAPAPTLLYTKPTFSIQTSKSHHMG
jgi:hypothetical protein